MVRDLVPPETIDMLASCPSGLGRVSKKLKASHVLLGMFTLGLYMGIHVDVTCLDKAESSLVDPKDIFVISKDDSPREVLNVWMAVNKEVQSEREVFVMISESNKDESLDQTTNSEEIK